MDGPRDESFLERRFALARNETTARRELVAGLTTFATLSYILFVQPALLGGAGMPPQGVLFATCVASALACVAMAFLANHPFALAPGMGHNVLFAFTVCGAMGFSWQQALAANLLCGLLFLLLGFTHWRERVLAALPPSLVAAIGAGIGLLISFLGLQWGGLVIDSPATLVSVSSWSAPVVQVTLAGLALQMVLWVRRVPGGLLIGLLGTTALAWGFTQLSVSTTPLFTYQGIVGAPPAPDAAFALDFSGLFARPIDRVLAVLLVLFLLDLFDTVGTLAGLGLHSGALREGRLPRARGAFTADALGTTAGALLGTSTVTSYVESAAGIAAGGRTGLTALVVGLLFSLALFFTPLIASVGVGVGEGGAFRPILAPILILVGFLMMRGLGRIAWEDPYEALPAFLTLIVTPMSFSITDGIAYGMIAASGLSLVGGRARALPPLTHVLALVFLARGVFFAL